jgi:hypothetical protein
MNNELISQLQPMLEDEELINSLTVLPELQTNLKKKSDRLIALNDVYKIFIPNKTTVDIYNRLYLSVINSLEKKNTIEETKLLNDNYRAMKGLCRYGVIGGLDSFKLTGCPGVGKTSSIQKCIDVITKDKVLKSNIPYREIIPILEIETVSDCSIKNLLYSILIKVDEKLGTNFYLSNNSQHTTVDLLLAAVSNVLSLHVVLLCIDEIERVVENKKGITLLNYLTQLINQSNVSICFIGTETSNQFFEMKEYLARRMLGISLKKLDYNEDFFNFCKNLFRYQYTNKTVELKKEIIYWFYNHSNGLPSMVVSLFVEAQRRCILSDKENLDLDVLNETYKMYYSSMNMYIENPFVKYEKEKDLKNKSLVSSVKNETTNLFKIVSKIAFKDINKAIQLLKDQVSVELI